MVATKSPSEQLANLQGSSKRLDEAVAQARAWLNDAYRLEPVQAQTGIDLALKVADESVSVRTQMQECYGSIGKPMPEHFEAPAYVRCALDSLEKAVNTLSSVADRLRGLAHSLEAGDIRQDLVWSTRKIQKAREAKANAVTCLNTQADTADPPQLPGDAPGETWLEWFLGLNRSSQVAVVDQLAQIQGQRLGELADFLDLLDEDVWEASAEKSRPTTPAGEEACVSRTLQEEPPRAARELPADHLDTATSPPAFGESADGGEEGHQSPPAESAAPDTNSSAGPDHTHSRHASLPEPRKASIATIKIRPATTARGPQDGLPLEVEVSTVDTDSVVYEEVDSQRIVQQELSLKPKQGSADEAAHAKAVDTPSNGESSSVQPGDTQFIAIPEHLAGFHHFLESFWLTPEMSVAPAPWLQPGFAELLGSSQRSALERRDWGRLCLLVKVAEELQADPIVDSRDLQDAIGILSGRSVVHCESRRAEIDAGLKAQTISDSDLWCLRVFLTAAVPGIGAGHPHFSREEVQTLLGAVAERGPLAQVVEALLDAAYTSEDPICVLRSLLPADGPKRIDPHYAFDSSRKAFHKELVDQWNAAGGKIVHTHSKRAWQEVMRKLEPAVKPLFPTEKGGSKTPDFAQISTALSEAAAGVERICENYGVAFADKARILQHANRLLGSANRTIQDGRRAITPETSASSRKRRAGYSLDPQTLMAFLSGKAEGIEGLCGLCLSFVIGSAAVAPEEAASGPSLADFLDAPSLLLLVNDVKLEEKRSDNLWLTAFADPILSRVAACYFVFAEQDNSERPSDATELRQLLAAKNQHHLLASVAGLEAGPRTQAARAWDRIQSDCRESLAGLRTHLAMLREFGPSQADLAQAIVTDLEGELSTVGDGATLPSRYHRFMLTEWATAAQSAVATCARSAAHRVVSNIRSESSELGDTAQRLSDEGRWGELALLSAHRRSVGEVRSFRATLPRKAARVRWKDPNHDFLDPIANRERLAEVESQTLPAVVDAWNNAQRNQSLKVQARKLAAFLLPKPTDRTQFSGKDSGAATWEQSCKELRSYLAEKRLNPCFLPQLAKFGQIRIQLATRPSATDDFVRDLLIDHDDNTILVIFAPWLKDARRTDYINQARRHGRAMVFLDSLDFARIIDSSHRTLVMLVPLMEIALEQWHPDRVNPFELAEGQSTRMEMFVGRREDAKQLVDSATYTRLFSGRKLGKTAFLKYVESEYDGKPQASGNTLRVIYVPIAGLETDIEVADKILELAEAKLRLGMPRSGKADDTIRELGQWVDLFVKQEPKTNIFFLLDEADSFVEAEIRRYIDKQEKCLTFRMRSVFEAHRDDHQMPRVRFVFSGYRATHRPEGAWSNWGDVMLLKPLPPDDAAALVAGPLNRIGINCEALAHQIAHKCGFQPAVLLRFGQVLISHLRSQGHMFEDEIAVNAQDVAATLDSQQVRSEIITVVENNFQGNGLGRLVFDTLLAAFQELPPGDDLVEPGRAVLDRLNAVKARSEWLSNWLSQDREGEVVSEISDLVKRELLASPRSKGGGTAVRLRYPHLLSVLKSPRDETALLRAVERLRQEGGSEKEVAEHRGLLPARELCELREILFYKTGRELNIRAVVFGAQWVAAQRELAVALGFASEVHDIRKMTKRAIQDALGSNGAVAFSGVSPEQARAILEVARSPVLLMGGADLLRAALSEGELVSDSQAIEVAGFYRLNTAALNWWFSRKRAYSFASPDAFQRIFDATSGIPLLVSYLDSGLKDRYDENEGGVEVSDSVLSQTITSLHSELPNLLMSVGVPHKLQDPEIQLLRGAKALVEKEGIVGEPLGDWLSLPDSAGTSPTSDRDAILLGLLGLLPFSSQGRSTKTGLERIGSLGSSDMLLRLL